MGRTARVRRDQVLAAAREAFLEGGYAGTTLAEIGGRVGVSPAAILRHAPTKKALFQAALGLAPDRDLHPLAFLEGVDGAEDPRAILRRVAEVFIPFIQERLREVVALYLHSRARFDRNSPLPLPFDPREKPTPPQRNINSLAGYLRRAKRSGRMRLTDPYAAAAVFLGSLHSYVFLTEVARALEEPLPVERFVDSLLQIWERGALRPGRAR